MTESKLHSENKGKFFTFRIAHEEGPGRVCGGLGPTLECRKPGWENQHYLKEKGFGDHNLALVWIFLDTKVIFKVLIQLKTKQLKQKTQPWTS